MTEPVLEINDAGYPTGNYLDADGNRIIQDWQQPYAEVPAVPDHKSG